MYDHIFDTFMLTPVFAVSGAVSLLGLVITLAFDTGDKWWYWLFVGSGVWLWLVSEHLSPSLSLTPSPSPPLPLPPSLSPSPSLSPPSSQALDSVMHARLPRSSCIDLTCLVIRIQLYLLTLNPRPHPSASTRACRTC